MLTTAILANMAILLLAILLLFFIRQGNSVPVEQFDLETLFFYWLCDNCWDFSNDVFCCSRGDTV
ncbi:hypothetical protein [Enterococcus bulliens]